MTRVCLVLLSLVLLSQTGGAGATFAQAVWGQPNHDPRTLTDEQIDPAMWPIVQRINQSGWVWTTESCEGHDAGPVLLGVVTDDPGRLFELVAKAQRREAWADDEPQNPKGLRLQVQFWLQSKFPALGAYQLQLLAPLPTQRALARRVLAAVAEDVNR